MENNSIIKSDKQPHSAPLTPAKETAIQLWRQQPEQSYAAICPSPPRVMIEADTPTLWEIRTATDHATAIGIIVLALIHVARLVNVKGYLNNDQIGEIANDVLEDYGYFKVEEIKHVLKSAIRTKKIYDRLDYNVVMGWFEEYSAERTEIAIRISEQKDREEQNAPQPTTATMSFGEYVDSLEDLAAEGDERAIAKLTQIKNLQRGLRSLSKEEKEQRDKDFKMWRMSYLSNKKKQ